MSDCDGNGERKDRSESEMKSGWMEFRRITRKYHWHDAAKLFWSLSGLLEFDERNGRVRPNRTMFPKSRHRPVYVPFAFVHYLRELAKKAESNDE
jgi:hypothetical protein